MDAPWDRLAIDLHSPALTRPGVSAGCTTLALRDEARLLLLRPEPRRSASLSLDREGSYFCISFTSAPALLTGQRRRHLEAGKLHILRQPAGLAGRQLDFASPSSLAVLVYFSTSWCRACPQGPRCKVARFLLQGELGSEGEGEGELEGQVDQSLKLDATGLELVRKLLAFHVDEDADLLFAEQTVLALLSWAFASQRDLPATETPKMPLQPRIAMKTRQAAEVLRQRLENPPTITELSRLVAMNESDLKRGFKCLYGSTIAGYSRRQRLEAARDLLTHSALSVADVALEIGFSNPSQFARAFRMQFGRNPSGFRQVRN